MWQAMTMRRETTPDFSYIRLTTIMHRARMPDKPDEEFLSFVKNINEQCRQHSMAWETYLSRLDVLTFPTVTAGETHQASIDCSTRNRITAEDKREAFGELRRFLSAFISCLEKTPPRQAMLLSIMNLRLSQSPNTGKPQI
jgi:hypothetical protein